MRACAVVMVLGALLLSACSGEESVPSDQVVVPSAAPDDWEQRSLAGVTFSTPVAWQELDLPEAEEGTARVGYADEPGPSGSTGGIVVMVVPDASLSAASQARTFLTNAQNQEQASDGSTEEISWPGAQSAWFVSYVAQVGQGEAAAPHPTRHLVLDLDDGTQVQVTVRAEEGTPAAGLVDAALATVDVTGEIDLPASA